MKDKRNCHGAVGLPLLCEIKVQNFLEVIQFPTISTTVLFDTVGQLIVFLIMYKHKSCSWQPECSNISVYNSPSKFQLLVDHEKLHFNPFL